MQRHARQDMDYDPIQTKRKLAEAFKCITKVNQVTITSRRRYLNEPRNWKN